MCDIQIPLTETAHDLLTSQNSQHDLAKIRLKSDSKAVRIVTVDLVVVDPEAGWAGGYDVTRDAVRSVAVHTQTASRD
jgi:hypothetical protein